MQGFCWFYEAKHKTFIRPTKENIRKKIKEKRIQKYAEMRTMHNV